jgi:hypothetical protein
MKTHRADNPVTPEQKRYIASELNLARLPYFTSSITQAKKRDSLSYKRVIQDGDETLEILWKVTADVEYGYPGPFAEAVHAAILDIVTEEGLPFENPVSFSYYNLCERLEIKPSGPNIDEIWKALYAIRTTNIVVKNSFVDKKGRRRSFYPDPVNLYERVIGYGETIPETGERAGVTRVWLADFYLESLNSGNIRPIDFEYFKHLHKRSYVATKLYKHLGYRFAGTFKHGNSYAKVDYDDLVCIGDIKRRRYLSRIKQQLNRAHEALEDTSFIKKIDWEQEKRTGEPNKFFINYYPGDRAHEEYKSGRLALNRRFEFPLLGIGTGDGKKEGENLKEVMEQASTPSSNTSTPLAHELEALGVSSKRAKELDQKYSEDRITRQLDHLEYLSEHGNAPKNIGGWLVSAIQEDYETPNGFKTRKERKAEEHARTKAADRKRKQEEAERREKEENEARRRRLDERLATLPEEERSDIEAAIAEYVRETNQSLIRTAYKGKDINPKSLPFRGDYYDRLEELLDERKGS